MDRYAKTTTVPVSRSRTQIQDILANFGVDEFFFGTSSRGQGIGFRHEGRVYKYSVPLPKRAKDMTEKQYEQALRRRWRVLHMTLKMKLEEIADGGMSFEDQFLAQMCLPNGSSVSDFMKLPENIAKLEQAEMPKMLTGQ
ncbi:hypothetical protein LCGC14_0916030 [marine sediment metagenome]|uniref:Uncharacterized protein n=1 Tax=marine sediment metagenome TaxID=412755 RepID=A0A0F9PCZ3_9ZZZZ